MKMRATFSFLIVLFVVSTFNITTSFAQAPPQLTRLHYPAEVTGFAYSPDSTTLAIKYEDGKVRIWDVEAGEIRHTLEHPNVKIVYDVAFSPDGTTLASANDDWKVHLWDVATGALKNTFIGHTTEVFDVAYSPDGTTLASSGHNPVTDGIRIWNAETGTVIHVIRGFSGLPQRYLEYSPDGTTLASGSVGAAHIFNVETGTRRHTLPGGSPLNGAAYSPDGSTFAFGSINAVVLVWDVATGTRLHRLTGHTSHIASVAYSSDGTTLASGSADRSVRLWGVATGTLTNVLVSPTDVSGVAYSPDGRTFATGSFDFFGEDGELCIWDATTGTRLHTFNTGSHTSIRDTGGIEHSLAYSPDSTTLAHWPGTFGTIELWRLAPPPPPILFTPSEVADQTFTVGTPVNLTLPFATGGTAPYTYNLAPLPNGLQFDSGTQVLQGTPLTPTDPTAVTYTATDATGASVSLTFTITVQDTPSLTDAYMYWIDAGTDKIQRANLDGTNIQDLVTGIDPSLNIALDLSRGKMYWTAWGTDGDVEWWRDPTIEGKIQRANLDGTGIETVVSTGISPQSPHVYIGLALDTAGGKMYWTVWSQANEGNKIQRANLDGTNVEDLAIVGRDGGRNLSNPGAFGPRGIVLDLSERKMYWAHHGAGKIQRANLDGTNVEDIVTNLHAPHNPALEFSSRKVYWTNWPLDVIQRANFDGTNVEDVFTPSNRAVVINFDSLNGKMYWTTWTPDRISKIQRANFDGSNVEDLVTGLSYPWGIALGIPQAPSGVHFNPNFIADQTFTVGTDVNLTLPTASGGTPPYLYTLAPTLPAGLYFDPIANGPGYIGGTPTAALPATSFTYTATDANGASAALTFTITVEADGLNLDVNGDGKVDVLDLVWVAVSYGMRGAALPGDVNADGVVNVTDLIAVAEGIDAGAALPAKIAEELLFAADAAAAELEGVAGAPVMGFNTPRQVAASGINAYGNIAAALSDAKHLATGDVRLGKWMPLLQELRQALAELGAIPEATALLPNYPNPFNPETWIPYHLATDAAVIVTIYDTRGVSVRELVLGHQPAGVYQNRGRAAYWDGRNDYGEPVASGVYFYTFTAGDFTATRKLLIRK